MFVNALDEILTPTSFTDENLHCDNPFRSLRFTDGEDNTLATCDGPGLSEFGHGSRPDDWEICMEVEDPIVRSFMQAQIAALFNVYAAVSLFHHRSP